MKLIGIILLICLFVSCGKEEVKPHVKEVSYKTTIHCDGCKETLTKRFNRAEGVTGVEIDVPSKVVKVKFDENKIKTADVANIIIDAGYDVEIIDSLKAGKKI